MQPEVDDFKTFFVVAAAAILASVLHYAWQSTVGAAIQKQIVTMSGGAK